MRNWMRSPTALKRSPGTAYTEEGERIDMKQYKTVKEVCKLTRLTRKHLYYFHRENVVRATAYANYSVEGNDGYKLYDEEAVKKLLYIALYYRFGLKRNEIRDLMLDPNYNHEDALRWLFRQELIKLDESNRRREALRCLIRHSKDSSLTPNLVVEMIEYLDIRP
jgi:DNA-binding transcriptional MerR regulator